MPGTRGPVPVTNQRDLAHEMLGLLSSQESVTTSSTFPDVSSIALKSAIDKLNSRGMITYETIEKDVVQLTKEATQIVAEGSHEYKVWDHVKKNGKVSIKDLPKEVGSETAKIGSGNAFKNKWIKKDGDSFVPLEKSVKDTARELLQKIQDTKTTDSKTLADLKKRKLVTITKEHNYVISKGAQYATEIKVQATDLTADMISDGSWEKEEFKPYNFKAMGTYESAGFHPLAKVREELRQIFFNQGFIEMPTNRYVDTGFWNFDTLFVPQNHSARDLQDTFYVEGKGDKPRHDPEWENAMQIMEKSAKTLYATPTPSKSKPRDYDQYWKDIKSVHQDGAFGSIGYRTQWSEDETLRLVLRTHTTVVSAVCLHRLAEDPRPARYFSIDRVFRNEAVDATHLAEFHQVEGVIADYDLTLGGLMKFLEDFFSKLGITNLRFKPAYNPYTEPSMEVFGYHGGLGKWVEIGNSGMFRPEMLLPMGLPKDLRVYGFGLSLERPTMIRYGVSNIRALLGHKVDLGFIKNNAAVRLDKQ